MKAIKIDTQQRKVYEVEVSDGAEINQHLAGLKECAHKFLTGDLLFIDGDGAFKETKAFKFGSKAYGFKTFRGNGVIINQSQGEWASVAKQLDEIKRIVKFPRKRRS